MPGNRRPVRAHTGLKVQSYEGIKVLRCYFPGGREDEKSQKLYPGWGDLRRSAGETHIDTALPNEKVRRVCGYGGEKQLLYRLLAAETIGLHRSLAGAAEVQ